MFEVHHDAGAPIVGMDGDDCSAGAVAQVAPGLAGRVELLRWCAADPFVAGAELVSSDLEDGSVKFTGGVEHDAGAGVEGTAFAVMLGHHARGGAGRVSVPLFAIDPPVGGETVEQLL